MTSAHIIGSGLIGTSVGLALMQAGYVVTLEDANADHAATADALGAGRATLPMEEPDLVILAVPPGALADVIRARIATNIKSTFTDVGSVKTQPVAEIQSIPGASARFVGGHPMAGRETSGPSGARADLFVDRLWILTPSADVEAPRLQMVRAMAEACGAVVTEMSPEAHDRAVALTSHAPQVLASLMAGLIAKAPQADIQLSGQGLRDVTRIAGSNPELWDDILSANAAEIDTVLAALGEQLAAVRSALHAGASLREMLHVGNAGRDRIPAKHGGPPTADAVVSVSIDDQPGALAALFAAAGDAGISIEDVRIDHMVGRQNAIVDLSVRTEVAQRLRQLLLNGGWQVRS